MILSITKQMGHGLHLPMDRVGCPSVHCSIAPLTFFLSNQTNIKPLADSLPDSRSVCVLTY